MITLGLAEKAGTRGRVVGVDFSEEMLRIARRNREKSKYRARIELIEADALKLPFTANTFDCAVIGYGLRNVADQRQALLEIKRVIKPGAGIAALELAHPYLPVFEDLYYLYLNHWIPLIGKLLAGNKWAYQYLDESVRNYPNQHMITELLSELGFLNPQCHELTFGIASIHIGFKPG
jgi:demethylmenaquinone methyltransferase/2-methoxy-6-polyprenyl-1,4-benzoquinol methylase